jgi:hypothetical protein
MQAQTNATATSDLPFNNNKNSSNLNSNRGEKLKNMGKSNGSPVLSNTSQPDSNVPSPNDVNLASQLANLIDLNAMLTKNSANNTNNSSKKNNQPNSSPINDSMANSANNITGLLLNLIKSSSTNSGWPATAAAPPVNLAPVQNHSKAPPANFTQFFPAFLQNQLAANLFQSNPLANLFGLNLNTQMNTANHLVNSTTSSENSQDINATNDQDQEDEIETNSGSINSNENYYMNQSQPMNLSNKLKKDSNSNSSLSSSFSNNNEAPLDLSNRRQHQQQPELKKELNVGQQIHSVNSLYATIMDKPLNKQDYMQNVNAMFLNDLAEMKKASGQNKSFRYNGHNSSSSNMNGIHNGIKSSILDQQITEIKNHIDQLNNRNKVSSSSNNKMNSSKSKMQNVNIYNQSSLIKLHDGLEKFKSKENQLNGHSNPNKMMKNGNKVTKSDDSNCTYGKNELYFFVQIYT